MILSLRENKCQNIESQYSTTANETGKKGRIQINTTKKDTYRAKRRKEEGGKKQREEDKISAIVCQNIADISSRILMVQAVSKSVSKVYSPGRQ